MTQYHTETENTCQYIKEATWERRELINKKSNYIQGDLINPAPFIRLITDRMIEQKHV